MYSLIVIKVVTKYTIYYTNFLVLFHFEVRIGKSARQTHSILFFTLFLHIIMRRLVQYDDHFKIAIIICPLSRRQHPIALNIKHFLLPIPFVQCCFTAHAFMDGLRVTANTWFSQTTITIPLPFNFNTSITAMTNTPCGS